LEKDVQDAGESKKNGSRIEEDGAGRKGESGEL